MISIIIPTRNRAALLIRAIDSVLTQTYTDFEIVVVIDGQDDITESQLRVRNFPGVRVLVLQEPSGGCVARNAGIQAARGEYVALLDDDDEWLPSKLERQMSYLTQSNQTCLVCTRYIDRNAYSEMVQPTAKPLKDQPISDYLFAEVSWLGFRGGFLQTSTWLARREVFLEVPFTPGLKRNQDTDWVLRAASILDLQVYVVWEPLVVFHNDSRLSRVTSTYDWNDSLEWAIRRRQDFTPRAFTFFIAVVCSLPAKLQGAGLRAFFRQISVARAHGTLEFKSAWLFFANWIFFPMAKALWLLFGKMHLVPQRNVGLRHLAQAKMSEDQTRRG